MSSILDVQDGLGYWNEQVFMLGCKIAADTSPSYNLSGMFYVNTHKEKPWGLLTVPNAMVRGVFEAMDEIGIELPPSEEGNLRAHISVMRPEEIEQIGGPDKLKNDRGKRFAYTIGRLVECEPEGWPEMSKCWMLRVHSPELQQLRRSYGLTSLPRDGEFDFHITVAVRRRGVLGRNDTAKGVAA